MARARIRANHPCSVACHLRQEHTGSPQSCGGVRRLKRSDGLDNRFKFCTAFFQGRPCLGGRDVLAGERRLWHRGVRTVLRDRRISHQQPSECPPAFSYSTSTTITLWVLRIERVIRLEIESGSRGLIRSHQLHIATALSASKLLYRLSECEVHAPSSAVVRTSAGLRRTPRGRGA